MTRQFRSLVQGMVLVTGMAFASACAQTDELDEDLAVGQEEGALIDAAGGCPYLTSDINQFHAKYVQAFNADDPPKIGCLYEGNATFVDPATGTLIMGRTNIQNQLVFYQTGTHMVATTRYAIIGGGNVGLLSAAYTIYDDASGGVVAAGQSADVVRRAANNMWMLVVDHPFGGQ